MKPRIKIDSALVALTIIISGILYIFRSLYGIGPFGDDVLDFIGFAILIKGILLRMAARGHKKVHSQQGKGLVMTGLYAYMRNPMYLGSFMIGTGYAVMVWPWWSLPIFAFLFYLRFNRQMVKEEEYLGKHFGAAYKNYCQKVPRMFPRLKSWITMNVKKTFPWNELWNTKEKGMLVGLPVLAVILETMQGNFVYGYTDIFKTAAIFFWTAVALAVVFWLRYKAS